MRLPRRTSLVVGTLVLVTTTACGTTSMPPAPPAASATATVPAPADAMSRSRPTGIVISSIGVDAPVISLGLTDDGTLEVPESGPPAGWYTGSPTPGEVGPAVIAGHVHFNDEAAVFEDLQTLRPSARIDVGRADGTTATFEVERVQVVDKAAFPTASVYGDLTHPGLRLITCGGYDPQQDTYDENVVVYASLAAPA